MKFNQTVAIVVITLSMLVHQSEASCYGDDGIMDEPIMELIVGYTATLLVSSLQLPQVYKTYKIKSAYGLSIYMIIFNFLASILWLFYGIILNKPPIYVSNIIYFIANCTLLIMKFYYKDIETESEKEEVLEKVIVDLV